MRNIVVLTPQRVTQTMVKSLVETLGGYWNDDETLNQGVVEREEAAVYMSCSQDLRPDYDAHDITLLTQFLGEAPQSVVDIHIGHGTGSELLAQEVAGAVIAQWGGFLDDNRQELAEVIHHQEGSKRAKPSA